MADRRDGKHVTKEMADERQQQLTENGFSHSSGSDEETPELNEQKQEERTLTDHLNKKLLESFLKNLDDGTVSFPDSSQGNLEEQGNDFNQ